MRRVLLRAGSSCLLHCLVISAERSRDGAQRREGIANCKTDRKLAKTTTLTCQLLLKMLSVEAVFDCSYWLPLAC